MAAKHFSHLFLLLSVGTLIVVRAEKTWCVAKPSSSQAELLENVNFACSQVDCRILEKGGACYSPDNLMNHASIAMNIYYQCKGRNPWNCHFGNTGLISLTDPSYGGCPYE
ncbi:putative glucan endo-1,3-beta-D-glucosidase [Helianthus annuus]|uniref:Glucan endo-1,3-beta-D-glucosidase n=1 Tax=Helianthus annuus TaxID=4232 RepID=A0A251V7G9_HELAN|nr:glucan endo-1,3-beta-glucosidase [Helianthus annuus]KAF5814714.1 putative glucan endo-1,3-beta-D-glucosidase [Helianthus annuus]KAJ0936026.1 putative glucan endo-1,3-beta-D-glucosidase [Helianthus annuus]